MDKECTLNGENTNLLGTMYYLAIPIQKSCIRASINFSMCVDKRTKTANLNDQKFILKILIMNKVKKNHRIKNMKIYIYMKMVVSFFFMNTATN